MESDLNKKDKGDEDSNSTLKKLLSILHVSGIATSAWVIFWWGLIFLVMGGWLIEYERAASFNTIIIFGIIIVFALSINLIWKWIGQKTITIKNRYLKNMFDVAFDRTGNPKLPALSSAILLFVISILTILFIILWGVK